MSIYMQEDMYLSHVYWFKSLGQGKEHILKHARLTDICLGSAAAPTFFPAHAFEIQDPASGKTQSFDLVDGGVAANNPVSSTSITLYIQLILWLLLRHWIYVLKKAPTIYAY